MLHTNRLYSDGKRIGRLTCREGRKILWTYVDFVKESRKLRKVFMTFVRTANGRDTGAVGVSRWFTEPDIENVDFGDVSYI
ncbi:hypothetical protein APHAL10511_002223 [Amanita phalloides]|nr:hypothetical protein APHAL10511_002223 [Amanita phalloides]